MHAKQFTEERPATGRVFRVKPAKGDVWFAKYRLPDGRQLKKRIGPAHTGRGRPPARRHPVSGRLPIAVGLATE